MIVVGLQTKVAFLQLGKERVEGFLESVKLVSNETSILLSHDSIQFQDVHSLMNSKVDLVGRVPKVMDHLIHQQFEIIVGAFLSLVFSLKEGQRELQLLDFELSWVALLTALFILHHQSSMCF